MDANHTIITQFVIEVKCFLFLCNSIEQSVTGGGVQIINQALLIKDNFRLKTGLLQLQVWSITHSIIPSI